MGFKKYGETEVEKILVKDLMTDLEKDNRTKEVIDVRIEETKNKPIDFNGSTTFTLTNGSTTFTLTTGSYSSLTSGNYMFVGGF